MVRLAQMIFIAMGAIGLMIVAAAATGIPMVYKDINNKVCKCATSEQPIASKEACFLVDMDNDMYETIRVRNCEE